MIVIVYVEGETNVVGAPLDFMLIIVTYVRPVTIVNGDAETAVMAGGKIAVPVDSDPICRRINSIDSVVVTAVSALCDRACPPPDVTVDLVQNVCLCNAQCCRTSTVFRVLFSNIYLHFRQLG